jgi:hypothetical protein
MRLMLAGGDKPVLVNLEQVRMVQQLGDVCRLTFDNNMTVNITGPLSHTLFGRLMAEAELADGTSVAQIVTEQDREE